MVTTCKSSFFACDDLGILVQTNDQSIKKQPCLWLVHGSGGISSNEEIWIAKAFEKNYTVVIVDSYTNRGVFKQNWESQPEQRIDPETRAQDQIKAFNHLIMNQAVVKFADLSNSKLVGFSDGGTAGLWVQHKKWPNIWKKSYCLYPATQPELIPDTLYDIRSERVHIFVGELDNWCPKEFNQQYQNRTGCELTVWPGVHHSYSKPGIAQWHEKTLNSDNTPGVYCEYSESATRATMEVVFDELD